MKDYRRGVYILGSTLFNMVIDNIIKVTNTKCLYILYVSVHIGVRSSRNALNNVVDKASPCPIPLLIMNSAVPPSLVTILTLDCE